MPAITGTQAVRGKRKPYYKCSRCPPGSESQMDALPLWMWNGKGDAILAALSVDRGEAWCLHCIEFAKDVLALHRKG